MYDLTDSLVSIVRHIESSWVSEARELILANKQTRYVLEDNQCI